MAEEPEALSALADKLRAALLGQQDPDAVIEALFQGVLTSHRHVLTRLFKSVRDETDGPFTALLLVHALLKIIESMWAENDPRLANATTALLRSFTETGVEIQLVPMPKDGTLQKGGKA